MFVALTLGKTLNFANQKYKAQSLVSIIKSDVRFLPFRGECFDVVISSEVLEHVSKPKMAIAEFERILMIDGTVAITTPNISLRWSLVEAAWTNLRREFLETHHVAFSKQRLKRLLIRCGFKNLHIEPFMFGCLLLAVGKKVKTYLL
jgi:2-polyprenyl-3-methyl-5-hydroxy-6-metoxy-1,4-benzoquinol methylase